MLESTIKNFNDYAPYLAKETLNGLVDLVLEDMIPSEDLMKNLVLRDTGKITDKEFFAKEMERITQGNNFSSNNDDYLVNYAKVKKLYG